MRRLVIGLLLLSFVLLVVDRVGAVVTAGVVADRLQVAGELAEEPAISIRGFPFLTQALNGRYDRVELTVEDVERRDLSLARLDVAVLGAQIPLGEALDGSLIAVPVEGLRATAVVGYDEVVRRSGLRGASVTPLRDGVRISGSVQVLGQTVRASTSSGVRVERGEIVVTARSIEVEGRTSALINRIIRERFDFRIDVAALPYGLRLTQVRAADEGLALTASTGPTVLQRP
jgi:hypothetical protein